MRNSNDKKCHAQTDESRLLWRFLQPVITLGGCVAFTLGFAPHCPCSQGTGTTFNLQREADPTHRLRWRVNGSQSRPGLHPSHRGSHPPPVVSTAPGGPVSFSAAPSLTTIFLGHGVEALTLRAWCWKHKDCTPEHRCNRTRVHRYLRVHNPD